jgi:hypothetical protein
MSIHKMMALHPDIRGALDDARATAARHAMFCAEMCRSCADACIAEAMDMRQCIRACLDSADVCAATAAVAVRQTGSNPTVLRTMLDACARICTLCCEECRRHEQEHCQLCAEMCRECAEDCRAAMPAIG